MASTQPAPADSMDPQQILATVASGSIPANWSVWRLRRDYVAKGMLEWALTSVVGFVLLVPIFLVTVPVNYHNGVGAAIFTSIVLLALAGLAFGGLGLLMSDLLRLLRADQYLLVMTRGDFLKVEPGRLTHVPMQYVGYVTLKGIKVATAGGARSQTPAASQAHWYSAIRAGRMGVFGGRRRRELRRPPSLAFLDLRTNREVIVSTDDAFGELYAVEQALIARARG